MKVCLNRSFLFPYYLRAFSLPKILTMSTLLMSFYSFPICTIYLIRLISCSPFLESKKVSFREVGVMFS